MPGPYYVPPGTSLPPHLVPIPGMMTYGHSYPILGQQPPPPPGVLPPPGVIHRQGTIPPQGIPTTHPMMPLGPAVTNIPPPPGHVATQYHTSLPGNGFPVSPETMLPLFPSQAPPSSMAYYSTQTTVTSTVLHNSTTWSTNTQGSVDADHSSAMNNPGSEGGALREHLFLKFGRVVQDFGPLEATNEKILNLFIKLTALERKLIMGQGSIKAFLGQCDYIRVTGNLLEVTDPSQIPPGEESPLTEPPEEPLMPPEAPPEIENGDPGGLLVDSNGVDEPAEEGAENIDAALFRRFGELLRDGPLEVTSQKVLNLFLKMPSAERRVVMSRGGIAEFLATNEAFSVTDNMLSLQGSIPGLSSNQLTSDVAPGLFPETSNGSLGPYSSESTFFPPLSILKVTSPAFTPRVSTPPTSHFLSSMPAFKPPIGNHYGVTAFNGQPQLNLNPMSSAQMITFSGSPPSSVMATTKLTQPEDQTSQAGSDLTSQTGSDLASQTGSDLGLRNTLPGSGDNELGLRNMKDSWVQESVDYQDKSEQTDGIPWPPSSAAAPPSRDMVPRRKYDQLLARAKQAEEKVIELQTKLCINELAKIKEEILENYIKIVRTPSLSDSDKSSLQNDYTSVMGQIQEETERVEILQESNTKAVHDGLDLKALPEISFNYPNVPKALSSHSSATFSRSSSGHMTLRSSASENSERHRRHRDVSESSSVLSVDSDVTKRPPGLDNLQELKWKSKNTGSGGETPTSSGVPSGEVTPDPWTERAQSQNTVQSELSAGLQKGDFSAGLQKGDFSGGLQKGNQPVIPQSFPSALPTIPGLLPLGAPFPSILPENITPETLQQQQQQIQMMMSLMPNARLPYPKMPLVPGTHLLQNVEQALKESSPVSNTDEIKTEDQDSFFPQAHDEDLGVIQSVNDLAGGRGDEKKKSRVGVTKTISMKNLPADVNSNLYHWSDPSEKEQLKPENELQTNNDSSWRGSVWNKPKPTSYSPTENWDNGSETETQKTQSAEFPPLYASVSNSETQDNSMQKVKPGSGNPPLHVSIPRSDSPSQASPVGGSTISPGQVTPGPTRKPLPVLHSSIDTVPVNVMPPGPPRGFSVMPEWSGNGMDDIDRTPSPPSPSTRTFPEKSSDTGDGATTTNRTTQGGVRCPVETKTMAGISEISMLDEVATWEPGWETVVSEDMQQWQQVGKKSKKKEDSEQTTFVNTNFEKLLQKIKDTYPKLSRHDVVQVVNDVRQNRGGLKGVSIAEILQDAAAIIREKWPHLEIVPVMKQESANQQQDGNLMYKTSICVFWQNGKCTKTTKECIYAHGKKDLKQLPKNVMCNNMTAKGACQYGDKCIFAHSQEEIKKYSQQQKQQRK